MPGALGENGNGGMVTGCAETPGCVAYIGISFLDQASQRGLGEAQLGNSSGNFLLPDAQSIQAAAAGFASKTPANQAISMIDGPAPDGYPIINYEYAIVNNRQRTPPPRRPCRHFCTGRSSTATRPRSSTRFISSRCRPRW